MMTSLFRQLGFAHASSWEEVQRFSPFAFHEDPARVIKLPDPEASAVSPDDVAHIRDLLAKGGGARSLLFSTEGKVPAAAWVQQSLCGSASQITTVRQRADPPHGALCLPVPLSGVGSLLGGCGGETHCTSPPKRWRRPCGATWRCGTRNSAISIGWRAV
jgi:hypothetical protein